MSTPSESSDTLPGDAQADELTQLVLLGQAGYYVVTGAWGLLDIGSFQKVTGRKVDTWLVKMVSVLVVVIGAVLGLAGRRRYVSPEIALLGVGSAAGFTGIDVFYVARKRISPVYLLDALTELILIGLWAVALGRKGDKKGPSS
jgi:hypothetical protein